MKFSVAIGYVTLAVRNGMVVVGVDAARLPPATRKPLLHPLGLQANHFSIPLKVRKSGTDAGSYWLHLTYPDGKHIKVAAVYPRELAEGFQAMAAWFDEDALLERLLANAVEINAAWLKERRLELCFMRDDEFPGWVDTYFKNQHRAHHYRVSEGRFVCAAGEMWIGQPELLDDENFQQNHPKCLFTFTMEENAERFTVWRFPWGADGELRWYAAASTSLLPPMRPYFEAALRVLGPRFWDHLLTIGIELGLPLDYDDLERDFADFKAGRLDDLEARHSVVLAVA